MKINDSSIIGPQLIDGALQAKNPLRARSDVDAEAALQAGSDASMLLPSKEAALEAARQFESIFIQQLIKDMRENDEAVGEGMFGEGVGNDIQEGLFDSMLSKRLAESGRIGFADHIVRDWEQRGRIAQAPTTADIEASGEATSPVASLGRIKTLGKPTIASIESAVKIRSLPQPKAQAAITDLEVLSHAPHSIP